MSSLVVTVRVRVHFNLLQRALVLEDYAPALGVRGFVSRKKGAKSMGEEKKEGGKKKKKKKLTGKNNMKKKKGEKTFKKTPNI